MTQEPTERDASGPAEGKSDARGAPQAERDASGRAEPERDGSGPLPSAGAAAAIDPPLPDTPEADLVRKARVAFSAGDYAGARELALRAAAASDGAVRTAAGDLLGRTRLDPVQVGIFAACLALFVGIAYWFVLR